MAELLSIEFSGLGRESLKRL